MRQEVVEHVVDRHRAEQVVKEFVAGGMDIVTVMSVLVTAALILVMVWGFDLSAIASLGSAVALFIFNFLKSIKPMPAVFDQSYVKRLEGKNVKPGTSKRELADRGIEAVTIRNAFDLDYIGRLEEAHPAALAASAEYEPPRFDDSIENDLFEGLVTFSPDGTEVPGVAESWEISDDGIEMFRPNRFAIERYRYRGTKIPTPWSSATTTGSPAPAA